MQIYFQTVENTLVARKYTRRSGVSQKIIALYCDIATPLHTNCTKLHSHRHT
jgi:hypothetical protein